MIISNKKYILILLILSACIKFSFLGKGLYSNQDENRYISAQNAVEEIKHGNIAKGIDWLFSAQGRPGYVMVSMVPATIQIVVANYLLIGYNNHSVLWIPYVFNLLVFLIILFIIYKISIRLGLQKSTSILITLLYSLTVNSYIYLRHAFPYDISLMILTLSYYYFISANLNQSFSIKKVFLVGLLISFAFTVYPGYFQLVLALFTIITLKLYTEFGITINGLRRLVSLIVGLTTPILFFQGLSLMVGKSYFEESKTLSGTIIQGSFEENHSFLFKYFFDAEAPLGYILFLLVLFCSALIISGKSFCKNNIIKLTYLALFLVFSIFIFQGLVFKKMVFYGRLLHQYYPFIIILCGIGMQYLIDKFEYKYFLFIISSIFFIMAIPNQIQYFRVEYAENLEKIIQKKNIKYRYLENSCEWDSCEFPKSIISSLSARSDSTSKVLLHLVNWCYTRTDIMLNPKNKITPDLSGRILIDTPHWINFPAYQYEGAGIMQREHFKKNPRRIMVLEKDI
jgi:hypothetical protein